MAHTKLEKLKLEFDRITILQLALVIFMLVVFLVLPIWTIVAGAFEFKGQPSLEWFTRIFTNTRYFNLNPGEELIVSINNTVFIQGVNFGIVLNSLIVGAIVTIFTTLIGTTLAFIMARYEFRGKMFFRTVVLIPMLVTPFINAFVIKQWLTSDYSLLNTIFYDTLHILPFRINLDGLAAIVLVQILSYTPIVFLNASAAIINVDPSLEEQGENLGAKGFRLLRTVTLPLALPGIAAGAVLVFIFSLEDLGGPIVFSSNFLARQIISYQVYSQFYAAVTGGILPETVALAVILLGIALLGFLLIKRYISLKTFAMLSKGGRWSPRIRPLGLRKSILVYPFLIIWIILSSFPQIGVFVYSFADILGGVIPQSWTLENYIKMISEPAVTRVITNSFIYSFAAVGLILVVGFSAAYLVARKKFFGRDVIDILSTMPIAIPGIVVAVGYFAFFSLGPFRGTPFDPLVSPALLITLAYAVRRMPFTVRSIFAGLQQVHVNLEEASMNLGASKARTYVRILIPLIVANFVGGAMLSFVYCMSETSVSITLGGLGEGTQPITWFMQDVMLRAAGSVPLAATLGVFLMLMQITALTLSNLLLKQRLAFLGI